MSFGGTYHLEDTIYIPFTTRAFATGIPTALVSGVIDVYEDVTATPILTAETLTVSLNGHAGFNMVTVTATGASGFEAGKSYTLLLDAGTVDSVSVIGEVVGQFNIVTAATGTDSAADIVEILTDTGTTIPGLLPSALVSGRMDSSVGAMAANVLTAAAINTDAITSDKIAAAAITSSEAPNLDAAITTRSSHAATDVVSSGAITTSAGAVTTVTNVGTVTGNVDGSVASVGAGGIDAAAIATDAIDADALAADAVTEIRSLVTGTADAGGSTTTMVDAALTEADDYWNGQLIVFTNGSVVNQSRLITDFDNGTTTMTFAPAVAASIGAGVTYEILPFGNNNDEIFAEMGQTAPVATPAKRQLLMWLFMALRNENTVDSSFKTFSNDAGTVIWKKALADDGTTFTESEGETGP